MKKQPLALRALLTLVLALGSITGCGDDDKGSETPDTDAGGNDSDGGGETDAGTDPEQKDIVDTAVAAGSFTVLASLLTDAKLVETLKGEGPFTVFAPTDAAFAALQKELGDTEIDPEVLKVVLKYHVIAGAEVLAKDIVTGPVSTYSGLSAWVVKDGAKVTVNDATVTTADVQASNGVIHVIDKVLLPPNIAKFAEYAGFSTLLTAVGIAGPDVAGAITNDAAPVTVFAPTNAAFDKFFTANDIDPTKLTKEAVTPILTYHVVAGTAALKTGSVETVNGADVAIEVDGTDVTLNDTIKSALPGIVTTSGVIYPIDGVLVPPT